MAANAPPKYCASCGQPLIELTPNNSLACGGCGKPVYYGPTVLVSALVFSDRQLLLIKRGLAPYPGKWAAPGGFVDPNESLEAAAARETLEESGVKVDPGRMVPHAVLSLPELNQVYVCFVATLESPQRAHSCLPESLDARWFTLADYPRESMWDPVLKFDIEDIFRQQESGKLYFYQRTADKLRKFGPYSS
jgi:ADP-ribose pyrophosphatase YjhB (NUDIX family)